MHREIALVGEFHETFEVPRREPGVSSLHGVPFADWTLRTNLTAEEGAELAQALLTGVIVEIAKEAADVVYIASGNAVQTGLVPTDTEENHALSALVSMLTTQMADTLGAIAHSRTNEDRERHAAAYRAQAAHIEVVVLGIAAKFGFDFDRVFDEVHRSNMSKANEDGTVSRREDGKVLKSARYTPADLSFLTATD